MFTDTRQAAIVFLIKNDQLQRMRIIVGSARDEEHILLLAGYKQK